MLELCVTRVDIKSIKLAVALSRVTAISPRPRHVPEEE